MKIRITKNQLQHLVNEYSYDTKVASAAGWPPAELGDDDEYERGYQDGLDGFPIADDAGAAYDSGYGDGLHDAELPEEVGATGIIDDPLLEQADMDDDDFDW